MTSIRTWTILLINLLIALVVVILSVIFYEEFKQALDQRVLLQLKSIKKLKRVQVEDYIHQEWKRFQAAPYQFVQNGADDFPELPCIQDQLKMDEVTSGIYDVSNCSDGNSSMLAFVEKTAQGEMNILRFYPTKIDTILLERTGMGNSGETYIVGADFSLRSKSRFFPDTPQSNIIAKTEGVKRAFNGLPGTGIIKDYRGEEVYSAYHRLEIPGVNWVILSEMDVAEVMVPLLKMRNQLMMFSIVVVLIASAISIVLSNVLTRPIRKVRDLLNSMSRGSYTGITQTQHPVVEIDEMLSALGSLTKSLHEAVHFANDIGDMNLQAKYELSGPEDLLGKSLIQMQVKLKELESAKRQSAVDAKRLLITGQEEERKRLSKELHDGLGPLLTSLKLAIQGSELTDLEKDRLSTTVDSTINEIRRMTYDLMPQAVVDFGVGQALTHFVQLMEQASGVVFQYEHSSMVEGRKLGPELDICIFRTCQELVNNSLKHSGASRITLSLTEFADKVSLYYTDNGSGFDTEAIQQGYGLRNITERIEIMDGFLEIKSNQQGTIVELEIPIKT